MIIPSDQLSIGAYHSSCPQWLSKTTLMDFRRMGPALWKLTHLDRTVTKERPGGADQGLALDCYLTEGPEAFASRYAEKPKGISFATKEGKAWRASQAGREIITADDHAILKDAVAAVQRHPHWCEIQECQAQATIRRHSDSLGIGLQSRPDWLNPKRGVLFDLKKTRDLFGFGRQAIDLGYHLQSAIGGWCLAGDGIALEHAYLVAVEWERGSRCRVYEIEHEDLIAGDEMMRKTAAEISDRLARNDWLDHPPEKPEMLRVPGYMRAKSEAN